jgi:hypothetical protein
LHTPVELLDKFALALRGGPLPDGLNALLTARDPREVEQRFAVYRNNVTVSLTEALAQRFPVIKRLVGEDFFAALARLYAEADRPRSPVLAEWGEGFAAFLAEFPPLAPYPYMADVARIEFARGRAFHAADAAPINPADLARADPDRVRLVLHHSVQVLRLAYPAVTIWARNQPDAGDGPAGQGPETALILRDGAWQVPVRAIGPGDTALVQAFLAGATLAFAAQSAQQAEPGHDPQPMLVALMRAGVIINATE